eukprot:scaffold178837_cov31-Tisochrysis_lutea.AAC.4
MWSPSSCERGGENVQMGDWAEGATRKPLSMPPVILAQAAPIETLHWGTDVGCKAAAPAPQCTRVFPPRSTFAEEPACPAE